MGGETFFPPILNQYYMNKLDEAIALLEELQKQIKAIDINKLKITHGKTGKQKPN